MFTIREVFPDDLEGLHAVASHLDTVNLPNDRGILEKLIEHSRKSFNGQLDVFNHQRPTSSVHANGHPGHNGLG